MNKPEFSERERICAACVIMGLLLLLLGGVLCVNRFLEYGRTGTREQERLFTQASVIDKNLAWNLSSVNQVLAALQKDRSWAGNDRGMGQRLKILTDAMPGVRTMAFLDAQGTVRASNWPELVGKNFKDREYFNTPRLHPDPATLFVSPPFKTSLRVFALILTRVLTGPDGKFAGIVAATLDPEYFTTLLSSVLYVPDMRSAIAHGDGTLFLSIPDRQKVLGRDLAVPDSFFAMHRNSGRKSSVFADTSYLYGERRLLVWHTVQPTGLKMDKPLLVTVSRDLDAVYQRWRFESMLRGGLFALVLLASSLGLYVYRLRQREFERQSVESAAALKESTERLELATSAASIGVWELELESGQVTWNDPMYGMYGVARGTVLSHELFIGSVHPDDLAIIEAGMVNGLKRGALDDEFRIARPDGEIRCIRAKAQVYYRDGGKPVRIVGVSFDVTESKEALHQLLEAKHQADAANMAKTQFLANMSHEIRTPMNAILGLMYLLQKTGLNPRQCGYAGKVQDAATSLLAILNDILDFSKVEAGRMELELVPFRLDDLLRNMSVILSSSSQEKDIEVLFDVDPEVPDRLVGDRLRLQQVLINLAGNAVKFTEKGEVVISVSLAESAADRVGLTVSIRDTGIGISQGNLERIFEGFTQAEVSTSRRFGGTGLGLAISSRLVRLMGGEIEVTSEEGRGSVFSFTVGFGLQPEDPGVLSAAVSRARPLHLLIADDNPTARELLAKMVAAAGWSADASEDGGRALLLLEKSCECGKKYDAVLIDWRMPGVEGVEASRRIRQLCQEQGIPVIVMATSYGRQVVAEAAQKSAGFDGFFLKPITRCMLLDAVADATRGYAPGPFSAPARRRFQGLRILLVEDNKVNQLVAREILEGEGAQVVVADNGREAVGQVRSGGFRFDAVLMDLQMPIMDGYRATREIRCALGELDLPIIAMTANAFEADRQRCLEAGLNAHLTKPIEVKTLVETLGRYCVLNEPQMAADDDLEEEDVALDAEEIAGLPGLYLVDTLQRLNGNRLLYGHIARMVCVKYADVGREVEHLWSGGENAAAGQLLHTFKGVILNMGAFALAESVVALEKALAQGRAGDGDEERQLKARFHALLAEAIGSLQIVVERYGESAVQSKNAESLSSSDSPLEQLQQLMVLLEASNMEAVDRFAIFKERFGASLPAERILWIGKAVEQLDFPAALEYCSVLCAVLESG